MDRKRKLVSTDETNVKEKKSKTSKITKSKPTKLKHKTSEKTSFEISDEDDEQRKDLSDECQFPVKIEDLLSSESGVPQHVAENFVKLIEDENTLPFIARYRKQMVDYMTPESLLDLHECYMNLCAVRKKAVTIIRALKKSKKWCRNLEESIKSARSLAELDLLYEPLKERSGTLADKAREIGLEKPASDVMSGVFVNLHSLCNPAIEGLQNVQDVETNLVNLVADIMYRDARVLEKIRSLKKQTVIYIESSKSTTKSKTKDENTSAKRNGKNDSDKYNLYFNFKMKLEYLKPHQILALNRGESEKVLSIKVNIPDWFYNNLERFCLDIWRGPLISKALSSAYKRLIKPWLVRRVRAELTSAAEKESIAVFASNLKRLLMTSPIKGHNILGIDPGFKAGCKIGVVSSSGQVLDTCVIYPNFHMKKINDPEYGKMRELIENYRCGVIALGNGTGCREMEMWVKRCDIMDKLPLVIVPEQGASIYSCSQDAINEHPGMDPNLISALSIARRALDPLSELIKVEPKHIGVGLYQHDIPPKLLNEALNNTIVYCASFVGADMNTASIALLKKIAGLTETKAKAIIKYRETTGLFKCRNDLLKVTGIGPKIFKQCAGFLRVPLSDNKLDNTWIHPECYDLALKILKEMKLSPKDVGSANFLKAINEKARLLNKGDICSKFKCQESDYVLIFEALCQTPHEDPLRNNKPVYSMTFNNIEQLKVGAILTGVVSNVTPFGCFVDCGMGRDGLIHTSQMGGSRIPQLGERVKVLVIPPLTDKIKLRLESIL